MFGKRSYDPIKPEAVKKVRAMVECRTASSRSEDPDETNPMPGWEKVEEAPGRKSRKSTDEELAPLSTRLQAAKRAAGQEAVLRERIRSSAQMP